MTIRKGGIAMTNLIRLCEGSMAYYLDGKEIFSVRFYKDGKVIASTRFFGDYCHMKTIEFPFDVKMISRPKLDLNRKEAFIVRTEPDHIEKDYYLYIHADLVDLKFIENYELINAWYSNIRRDRYSITLTGEKIVVYEKEGRTEIAYEKGSYEVRFTTNSKCTETDEWKKCQKMAEEMSQILFKNIDGTDVHRLLEHYKIIKKRKKK